MRYSKTFSEQQRLAYAVERMEAANRRMLNGSTSGMRIRAGMWVTGWSLVAGAEPPTYLHLRSRSSLSNKQHDERDAV